MRPWALLDSRNKTDHDELIVAYLPLVQEIVSKNAAKIARHLADEFEAEALQWLVEKFYDTDWRSRFSERLLER